MNKEIIFNGDTQISFFLLDLIMKIQYYSNLFNENYKNCQKLCFMFVVNLYDTCILPKVNLFFLGGKVADDFFMEISP